MGIHRFDGAGNNSMVKSVYPGAQPLKMRIYA